MTTSLPDLFALALLAMVVAGCLAGIRRLRSRSVHERGHLLLSFLPWLHLLSSYAVAAYVRIGFGAWPRSCIDNPDLPMLRVLVLCLVLGLLVVPVGGPVWLGWLVIRRRRGMTGYWLLSTLVFITGLAALVAAQKIDPWGFWNWVWD